MTSDRGIASDISDGIAYRNVSDGVANDIAHVISNAGQLHG